MEYQKIINLLDTTSDCVPRFITKKWVEVHDQSNKMYSINKQTRFKTLILQSDLCGYSDPCIVFKGTVTVEGADNRDRKNRSLAFKNNAPFISGISKINNVLIDNAEALDIVMPMSNLIEYSKNYEKTTGSLWNYYRDIPTDPVTNSESFKCKASITGKTPDNDDDNNNTKKVEFSVILKYESSFWKTLNIPLIN